MSYFKSGKPVQVKSSVFESIEAELKKISKSKHLQYHNVHFFDDADYSGNLIFDIELGKLEAMSSKEQPWVECENLMPVAEKLKPMKFKLINFFVKKDGKNQIAYATFCRIPNKKEMI